jgi:hypothetical protein
MVFTAQLNIPNIEDLRGKFPLRAYVDESWDKLVGGGLEQAAVRLSKARKENFHITPFSLATLWANKIPDEKYEGDTSEAVQENMDFFLFDGMNPWPGNPDIEIYSTLGGDIITPVTICGHGAMVLGQEEQYRKGCCKSLDEYINSSPIVYTYEQEEVFVPRFGLENGVWAPLD